MTGLMPVSSWADFAGLIHGTSHRRRKTYVTIVGVERNKAKALCAMTAGRFSRVRAATIDGMQAVNRFALKEWASVCAAIAAGRQSVLLRKGGIDEGPGGFRVQHEEFWMYPTRFHQQPDELAPDAATFLDDPAAAPPPDGVVRLSLYAVATRVERVNDPERLAGFAGRHILSESAVQERFQYRAPGLFVIELQTYRREKPHEIEDRPEFAGCHSWVDLGAELEVDRLTPVAQ